MVSHAVWKTWPSGLSYDKNLGLRPRFLSTESLRPCFSHGMGDYDQIKGLRPVLEGFVVTMHEGACEPGSQIPRDLTYCSHKPECIVTTKPDRSVLITIITWHFQFRPVNASILHLKDDYRARSESRFACYSHYYVTWCPLTTGIVTSQCPSARDAVLVTRYLMPFISACLNSFLQFLPQ